jgi:hypothetical protein
MFNVKYRNGSGDLKVYAVRENEGVTEFLLNSGLGWYWQEADDFIPAD